MLNILIIEDEQRIAQNLSRGLQEQGYIVDCAPCGQSGKDALEKKGYALVILDVMLPGMDGWEVLHWLRGQDHTTPVLMLTAQNDLPSKIKGLKAGADDYLTKPFAFNELLARMEAIFRRTRAIVAQEVLEVASLKIHLKTQTVTRDQQKIDLSPKEFQLLCVLAENTGRLVSRKTLVEQVWQIDFEYDTNVVDVAIRRLRQKMDEGFAYPLIHTVRGGGYVLERRPEVSPGV